MLQESEPSIDIFYGAEVDNVTERRFLTRLTADLRALGIDAVILVNFHVGEGPQRRQVDFVVATAASAAVVEVKGFTTPVVGTVNGPWILRSPSGADQPLSLTNPYNQALSAR